MNPERPIPNSVPIGTGAAPPTEPINARTVVAAWTEATEANGSKPPTAMKAQVGREAREQLTKGVDPALVLAAARQVGAKGLATLAREIVAMQGRKVTPLRSVIPYADSDGVVRDPKTGVAIER